MKNRQPINGVFGALPGFQLSVFHFPFPWPHAGVANDYESW
jgi:hypothetical protein